MAELKQEDVFKYEILPHSEWADKYAKGITNQAVSYLMKNDVIDFVQMGRFKYVVLTEKTLEYVPADRVRKAVMRTGK